MRRLAYVVSLSSALVCACSEESEPARPDAAKPCDNVPEGAMAERTRFAASEVVAPAECESEVQYARCVGGELGAWTGTYAFDACTVRPQESDGCAGTAEGETITRTRYAEEAPPLGQPCMAQEQTATCLGGELSDWSGDYTAERCKEQQEPDGCDGLAEGEETTRVRYLDPVSSSCALNSETQLGRCTNGKLVFDGTYSEVECVESYEDDCGRTLTAELPAPCMRVPSGDQARVVQLDGLDDDHDFLGLSALRLDGSGAHALALHSKHVDLLALALDGSPRETARVKLWDRRPGDVARVRLSDLRHGMRAAYSVDALDGQSDVVVYRTEGALEERVRWDSPDLKVTSVALTQDALWVASQTELEECVVRRIDLESGAATVMNEKLLNKAGAALDSESCGLASDDEHLYVVAAGEREGQSSTIYGYDLSGELPALRFATGYFETYEPSSVSVSENHLLVVASTSTFVMDLAAPERVQHIFASGQVRLYQGRVYANSLRDVQVFALAGGARHMSTLPHHGDVMDVYDGQLVMSEDSTLTIFDLTRESDMVPLRQVLQGFSCDARGPSVLCNKDRPLGSQGPTLYVRDGHGAYARLADIMSLGSVHKFMANSETTALLIDGELTLVDHASGKLQTVKLGEGALLRSLDDDSVLYSHACGSTTCITRRDLATLVKRETWPVSDAAVLQDNVLWTVNGAGLLSGYAVAESLPTQPLGTLQLPRENNALYRFEERTLDAAGRSLVGLTSEGARVAVLVDVTDPAHLVSYRSFENPFGTRARLSTSERFAMVSEGLAGNAFLYPLDHADSKPTAFYGARDTDLTSDGRMRVANFDGVFESEPLDVE